MASNARDAGDWRWAPDLREEAVGFAPYNVMAVFARLPAAEEAVERLRGAGFPNHQISLRTRTITDDPPATQVEPALEVPMRRRDAQIVGRVARRVAVLSSVLALGAALLGFLLSLGAGFSTTLLVIIVAVSAVAGGVVGAVWGGEIGSMGEARKEEGVVVGAHPDDRAAARRAEGVFRGLGPLRIDRYDGQGRPLRQL